MRLPAIPSDFHSDLTVTKRTIIDNDSETWNDSF